MVNKTDAIRSFLQQESHPDLANLYNFSMECQVNAAPDDGERIEGDYKGRRWHGWRGPDGKIWKSFRIPWNAKKDPHYEDSELTWDLMEHAEGIGMTGWDWENKKSRWVAFDFDSMVGHSQGLSREELSDIERNVQNVPWVTVRLSTSGKGLHLYVFIKDQTTNNHTEHAAVARAILGKLSALTGYDFNSKVDVCGGNMWVWHRKMRNTEGLKLIKQGTELKEVPINWKDHLDVVRRKKGRNIPNGVSDSFMDLASQKENIPLDEEHKKFIKHLANKDEVLWWWDQDHHMLVTHTKAVELAHKELGLRGFFKTTSEGTNLREQNCFLFPLRNGAWSVRRYTKGVEEHPSWIQDGLGWTRCYINREATLEVASRAFNGVEDPKGGFYFKELKNARESCKLLGIDLNVPENLDHRSTTLKEHKNGKVVVEIDREPDDSGIPGWLVKKNKPFTRMFNPTTPIEDEPDNVSYDHLVRHIISQDRKNVGWTLKAEGKWQEEPKDNVKNALQSIGLTHKEMTTVLGNCVFKAWRIVNKPFEPEYPGGREWNREAAKLRFTPSESDKLHYPTWTKVLSHMGTNLQEALSKSNWARLNGIKTGADYLKCWIACLFQYPSEPLPYLFFWGSQDCGKSIFHESIQLLMTEEGYINGKAAISSKNDFNKELQGCVLCYLEEKNLNKDLDAYNKIKDWVTTRKMLIHPKGETPYQVGNTSHWVQCANHLEYCPAFPGDTRITVINVPDLDPLEIIPKAKLIQKLEKEAPDFLASLLSLEVPESPDRIRIPILKTDDKEYLQEYNQTPLQQFLKEEYKSAPGYCIKYSDLYDHFIRWLTHNGRDSAGWTKIRFGRNIGPKFLKGPFPEKMNQQYVGNIAPRDKECENDRLPFEKVDGNLIRGENAQRNRKEASE